jgi:hypothetical protein
MIKEKTIPLSQRPIDIILIIFFALFFIIAYTIDIIPAVSPFGSHSKPGITPELLKTYWWAPIREKFAGI